MVPIATKCFGSKFQPNKKDLIGGYDIHKMFVK